MREKELIIPRREIQRSFRLHVLNGAIFNFVERLIDPPVVLARFVSELTNSNLLAGLVVPMGDACWFLPQLFASTRIQRMERKMPRYIVLAMVRVVTWFLLAVTVWFVDDPLLLLVGFFTLFGTVRLLSGLAGLVFFDITAKTIPANRRGSLFSMRQFFGGILGLGAGWLMHTILDLPNFTLQQSYAVLFAIYSGVTIAAYIAFVSIREPPGMVVTEGVTFWRQLDRARQIVRQDLVYRRYLAARLSLGLAGIALPFYGIYAKDVLQAPVRILGVYVATRVGAQLLSNLVWGRISDRLGNRLVMKLLCLGNSLTVLLALTMVGFVAVLHPQGGWLPYMVLPLYALDGAVRPGYVLAGSNFLLELAPEAERSLYLGLCNTLMGIMVLVSGLGGLLVDVFGFSGLFIASLGLYLTGYGFARGLPEPRENEK